jgi:dienelactone hydrolase
MRIGALLTLALLATLTAHAGVVGKEVQYSADGVTLKGYVAYDDATEGKRPGILVVHEWWGLNAYPRRRADMLAGLGYVAFAVDMFGDGKQAADAGEAGKLSGAIFGNPQVMKARFMAALHELKLHPAVDTSRLGAIGYCFWGGVALAMARMGAELQAVVTFHGVLGTATPASPGAVKAKLLVCNGADDKFISAEDVRKFKEEMKAAKADMTFINYAGSLHAFTNPDATKNGKKYNIPIAYNAPADKKSWADMQSFLKKAFKK